MKFLIDSLANSQLFYLMRVDITGRYTFVNNLFLEKFGYKSQDLIGMHYTDSVHPEDINKLEEAGKTCVQTSASVYVELRKTDRKGNYFWTAWELSCMRNEDGIPIYIQSMGTDITPYKLTQEYVEEVDAIIENLADGFLVVDKQFRIMRVNHTYEKMFAQQRENLLRQSLWSVYATESHENAHAKLVKAFEENIPVRFEDYHPLGNKWLDVHVVPFGGMLLVFFRDITEKKNQTEALRQAKQQVTSFFDSTPDVNILISKDFKVLSFNKVASKSLKAVFGRDISVGDSFTHYFFPHTEDLFYDDFQAVLDGQRVKRISHLQVGSDLFIWYSFKYHPVYDEDKQLIGVAFSAMNIDEHKKSEEHILEQNRNLQAIAWLQSHSLRRPVASILGLISLIDDNVEKALMLEVAQHLKTTGEELDVIIHEIVEKTYPITYLNGNKPYASLPATH
jgi:PAS domain S-box-containing protein